MISVRILKLAGDFAEDKDTAAKIRREQLLPLLESGGNIELDFRGVNLTTQSFIHALISEALRKHGESVLEHVYFKDCEPSVRDIISTVTQYVLESREDDA